MIAEIGHFILLLSFCIALVQAFSCFYRPDGDVNIIIPFIRRATIIQCVLVMLAFLALTTAFIRSDFSLYTVFSYSHVAKPLIYKIAGVWGNHEGSMLLWIVILSCYSAAFAQLSPSLPPNFQRRILITQGWMSSCFLAFLIFTSNPFTRLSPAPFEGQGLNPILQDPALAMHPPLLYAGYVGFSIVFSFALAALREEKIDQQWAQWMQPWALLAWIFLTLGIALGSFWAYYELGWGGFWFWDPVENASLMPWLTGTALIHCLLVVRRGNSLKSWTILLSIITFCLSLAGTFLVRSGVLTSVHSFANDPMRGIFILAILAFFTTIGLIFYARYGHNITADKKFKFISKESLLLTNNIFLATATITVFIGTIYPLILDTLGLGKISVGAPYFNTIFAPLILPFLILLPLGPMIQWRSDKLLDTMKKMMVAALLSVFITTCLILIYSDIPLLMLMILGASIWVILGAITDIINRLQQRSISPFFWQLWMRLIAPPIAHGGMGIMIIGIIAATSWRGETVVALQPGDTLNIAGMSLRFDGVKELYENNYIIKRARLTYLDGRFSGMSLLPERRFYTTERSQTTEAAIHKKLSGHLYAVIGEAIDDKHIIRVWYYPWVVLIWIGGIMMALAGMLSLLGRLKSSHRDSL